MTVACGNRHAVHQPGEHHDSVAQVRLCHSRPFGLWSTECHERGDWERFLDSLDTDPLWQGMEAERLAEQAAERATERFYEEGTPAQQGQYLWEVEMDERNAMMMSGRGLL